MHMRHIIATVFSLLFFCNNASYAGQGCQQKPPSESMVTQGLALAVKTIDQLNASGAEVVVIGRVGQDLSKYKQHYSHVGFAYKDGQTWRIIHKLNECGTAISNIYQQGMGQFFLDDPFKFEAAFVVPTQEVQKRILAILTDPKKVLVEHTPQYSMLAYAWATKYQQSNQWMLETLALAMEPQINTREQAQAWLKFKGYKPSILSIGPMTRLAGRVFKAMIIQMRSVLVIGLRR